MSDWFSRGWGTLNILWLFFIYLAFIIGCYGSLLSGVHPFGCTGSFGGVGCLFAVMFIWLSSFWLVQMDGFVRLRVSRVFISVFSITPWLFLLAWLTWSLQEWSFIRLIAVCFARWNVRSNPYTYTHPHTKTTWNSLATLSILYNARVTMATPLTDPLLAIVYIGA